MEQFQQSLKLPYGVKVNMRIVFRPVCWVKTVWRSLGRSEFVWDGILVDGCDFVEQENGDLVCEICGKISRTYRSAEINER